MHKNNSIVEHILLENMVKHLPNNFELGQMVRECYNSWDFFIKFIQDYPNDYDLGYVLRYYYHNHGSLNEMKIIL